MIYMSTELQQKVIPRFHFALKNSGGMLLGPSESLAGEDELFDVVDKSLRLFKKNDHAPIHYTPLADRVPMGRKRTTIPVPRPQPPMLAASESEISRERQAVRAYLADHAKAFALVSGDGNVAYLSEAMTRFVHPSKGEPSARIDAFLASDLRIPVRSVIAEAASTKRQSSIENVVVIDGARKGLFDISASPAVGSDSMYLLVLDPIRIREGDNTVATVEARQSEDRVLLEREMASVREQYVRLQADHENTIQEANSSNEELLSMNEELQSSNEELETSREELQSINEELETVNAELSENNRQLVRANSDLKNLFESTDMATLFLDPSLAVRSFTPATTRLFGIRNRDVGRPIRDLSSSIDYPQLEADAEEVQRTLQLVEREVTTDATEETFILRMRPYRTTDDRLDGFVLAFYDITQRKRNETQLARNEEALARQYGELETLYDTTPVGLSLVDKDLRWLRINKELADINGFPVAAHIGKRQQELIPDIDARVAETQREVLRTGKPSGQSHVEGFTPADPDRLRHWMVEYYPVFSDGEVFAVGTCVREVTNEFAMTRRLAESEARLQQALTQNPIHFIQLSLEGQVEWAKGGLEGLPRLDADDEDDEGDATLPNVIREAIETRSGKLADENIPQLFDVTLNLAEENVTYQIHFDNFRVADGDDGYILIATDITDRRELEDRQKVLMGELQHRVKNTLATISAISRFLVQGVETPAAYQERLDQRLRAISRSHDLLTSGDWQGSSLREVLLMEAAPYTDTFDDRIKISGDDLKLSPREAVSIGMAFHELMTNAAKYGALSTEKGMIEIDYAVSKKDADRRIVWKERGGPAVEEPAGNRGFGSFLIERVLAADLQGEVELLFQPDGLCCTIAFPEQSAFAE